MKSVHIFFTAVTAVNVSNYVSFKGRNGAIDVTDLAGGDIIKEIQSDHNKYKDYKGATLTDAIIKQGKKRAKKGQGCKHVGYMLMELSDDEWIYSETCEDACIWAGGEMRIA